jgi:hypothetical protein
MIFRRLTLACALLLLVCLPARAADVDLLMGNPSQARPDQSTAPLAAFGAAAGGLLPVPRSGL